MYTKIKKSDLYKNNVLLWNPTLSEHIANELHKGTFEYTHQDVEELPRVIQHLHFLWRAQCEIGGSGFNYLYQGSAQEIRGIYNAFVEVKALRLVELMGQAIALANDKATAEYNMELENQENLANWFAGFTDGGDFNDLEQTELNQAVWDLVTEYLDEKIVHYIENNLDQIAK